MNNAYQKMRKELGEYYLRESEPRSDAYYKKIMARLDNEYDGADNVYQMKAFQHHVIADSFDPVIFPSCPFYYEMGLLAGISDGARRFRGHYHAGGWTFWKNEHKFAEQNSDLLELTTKQKDELLYLICGKYNDYSQHFCYNYRPVLQKGLSGVYQDVLAQLQTPCTDKERDFLTAVAESLISVKTIAQKFADCASALYPTLTDETDRANVRRIAESAAVAPWEAPRNFYEALNTLAFLRVVIGSLEGVGPNTFGRPDLDLLPFYQKDLANGTLKKKDAYDLICQFLIAFDLHYDHDMPMVSYADHELENTYVLGGCDTKGEIVYNDLTSMFLRASREEDIIFPKIKCRFSKNSPKAYLDEINRAVINGTTTVLFSNDDAIIPALVKSGIAEEDARDYVITGCWGLEIYGKDFHDHGNYINLLKPFEFSIHHLEDKMEKVGLKFGYIDEAKTFEEVYAVCMENFRILLEERARVSKEGGQIWDQVDVLPFLSATHGDCVKNKKDYTSQGARYCYESYTCFGLPNIVDSLLAIKTLVFDQQKYTLSEFLSAVRDNWKGNEQMRIDATKCHGWGDNSDESNALASRFHDDLGRMINNLKGGYGTGKVVLGYVTYTEIRFWGEQTLATPDGRKNGEYFAQGLTPSRLKKIRSATDVVGSFFHLDHTTMAGNSVVNVILPATKITLDVCEAFLRAVATSAVQNLQLNVVTKEQLLDAQRHPEKYPHLIVRVCGFSAKFTSLSREWQDEFLSRNFYE